VPSAPEATVAVDVGGGSCAQIVPNSSALLIIPAHSSARGRRESLVPQQTLTRTYTDRGIGLKILVSAVQSRPCPPLFSNSCPSENSSKFVPSIVPNSGTRWSISAHLSRCIAPKLLQESHDQA
jgi:hypothetical protein